MARLFHASFEFEHELAGNAGEARDAVRLLTADLSVAWMCMAEPGDAILVPEGSGVPESISGVAFVTRETAPKGPDWEYVPWGWTPERMAFAGQQGWRADCPPLEVVRRINHRAFRFELEQELSVAPVGAYLATTLEDVERAVKLLPGRWIIKAGYGMAGREQWRGKGPLDSASRAGIARRLAIAEAVVVEPWLPALAEAGIQIQVPKAGPPEFLDVIPQLVDSFGVYRGSRFGAAADWTGWEPAVDVALAVARRVQKLGYFGPLGIDAMQYRDADGQVRLRPLQDLNARWTMGRMAWSLSRQLPSGGCGSWLLLRWRGPFAEWPPWFDRVQSRLPAGVSARELSIPTSDPPDPGRSRPRRVTVILTAPNRDLRCEAEDVFLAVR